ncbi:Putative membrane protein YeiH OS=Castellaniella defragrans OX=75697 GN=HNR28_001843 PE=3 SV=1 [Castellaniella defragrans]
MSVLAGLAVFFWDPMVTRALRQVVLWFDAVGLAFFAVVRWASGCSPVMAALLGMLTGVGGGRLRDVLVMQIPTVLRADLYALSRAALAGAAIVAIGHVLELDQVVMTTVGGLACFLLRYMAIRHGWRISSGRGPDGES